MHSCLFPQPLEIVPFPKSSHALPKTKRDKEKAFIAALKRCATQKRHPESGFSAIC
jgi:hypothetical protein